MLRNEVLEIIQYRLGDHSEMAARALVEMPLLQSVTLEGNSWLPWFLEVDSVGLACTAGTPAVTLPEDFLAEMEEGHLWILIDGKRKRLVKQDFDTAQAKYQETGQPLLYSLGATEITLFPTPDQDYDLDFKYYGKAAPMHLTNIETPWLQHAADLVIALLCEILAGTHMQNPQLAQGFKQAGVDAWNRLYAKHVARSEVNQSRTMGGNT